MGVRVTDLENAQMSANDATLFDPGLSIVELGQRWAIDRVLATK